MNFSNKKVLVVGAHADDEVLGCGGTIHKFTQAGSIVDVLILTDSVSSQYESRDDLQLLDDRRSSSLEICCKRLGVRYVTQHGFPACFHQ